MRTAVVKAVISNQVLRSIIEIIVPTIIELKRVLEREKSPFLEDLFVYLKKVRILLIYPTLSQNLYSICRVRIWYF